MTTLALVLMLTAAAEPASDEAAAKKSKELFATAQKLYKQGKFTESISKLEEAYAAKPYPVIFFNIAKCHEQLNDVPKALRAYKDYLRLKPDATDRQEVSDSIANLERKLKDKGLTQVLVFAEPATAHVEIDGLDIGVSPASTEVSAGNHTLTVKAEGFLTLERGFNVTAGRSQELTVALNAKGSAASSNTSTSSSSSSTTTASSGTTTSSSSTSSSNTVTATPSASSSKRRLFTWVAAGVAVAGLGAGIGLGVTAQGAASRLTSGQAPDSMTADAWQSSARGMSLGANVAYGVAAVALVAAVVLFFLEK
ncbi:MAG: PEGA domain-containing protein [Myxococcaceae bacterium]|nr:PEGA domain-containing protein [Myxococcaceae bacterium]